MRLLVILVLIFFAAAGIVLGALNADLVSYDLAFMQLVMPKGAALLGALMLGWLLGGLTAWLGTRWTLGRSRRKLAKARKQPVAP